MTVPRFWTDPLSGAAYPFKGQLTAAQMNAYVTALQRLDYAIERSQAMTFPGAFSGSGTEFAALLFDETSGLIYTLAQFTGSTSVEVGVSAADGSALLSRTVSGEPAGGWTTTAKAAMAVNGSGTVLIGGATVNASGGKVALAAEDAGFAVQTLNTTGAGVGVTCAVWDATHSLWIVGLDGGSNTTRIETSANGTSWTNRTTAAAVNPLAMATDGSGTTVAVGNANVGHRSTDGTTWASVSMPTPGGSGWKTVTYSAGLGLWFASDGASKWATSPTGVTWTDATSSFDKVYDGSDVPFDNIGSLGNLVIGQDSLGGIWASEDGLTFRQTHVSAAPSATGVRLWVGRAGIVAAAYDSPNVYLDVGLISYV